MNLNLSLPVPFFLLFIFVGYSQQRLTIQGGVYFENVSCRNITIRNITSASFENNSTISDDYGIFYIKVKQGDILLFSSFNLDSLKICILSDHILTKQIKVEMKRKVFELEEVIINKNDKINAVSLGIIPKSIKTRTLGERRLYTAGDFKPIQLLTIIGGGMQLDPVFNALNGKTKRLKKELLIEKKGVNFKFLKENYSNYTIEVLKVTENKLSLFFNFIVDLKDAQKYIENNDDLKIKFFLCDQFINNQEIFK